MKKLIAIATADLHFEDWKQFNENGRRIDAHIHVWEELGREAELNDVPIFFAGDMFNNPKGLSNKLIARVFPVLQDTRCTVIGIDGNHDQDKGSTIDSQPNSYFSTLSKIFPQFIEINFKRYQNENFVIHGVPYLTLNVGFEEYVKNIKLSRGTPNILMIHSDLPGALDTDNREVGSVQGISAQYSKLFKRFDLVISGHIHKHQQLASNVYMLGAPLQQRRTDRNCKMGYCKIYDDMSVEFVELKDTPKFKTYTDEPEDTYHYWDREIRSKKKTRKEKPKEKKATGYREIVRKYAKDKGISKVKTKKLLKIIK